VRLVQSVLFAAALLGSPAMAAEFQLKEVDAPSALDVSQLKPRTIYFSDRRNSPPWDARTALVRFDDWARARPVEKEVLSLHPRYAEPTINVTAHGITKRYTEKLHMFIAEARFLIGKAPQSIDLRRYARLDFVERIDPAIKHKPISPDQAVPLKDPEEAHNRHPERRWCEGGTQSVCIQSRYQLEGRIPAGIRLANKLQEDGKKIAEFVEFQSELRLLTADEVGRHPGMLRLTGLNAPPVGAFEQSIFHVNQMMQFGKILAIFQQHPSDPGKTVVTAYIALAVETDVLDKKKEYESVPILRNMVPIQVLTGNSSFNTGTSISAGLPDYTRNRAKAIARILDAE
jgi:hypothetical protein